MFTRMSVSHQMDPQVPAPVNTPGALSERPVGAVNNRKPNITAMMPLARPNSSPSPDGAPFYLGDAYCPSSNLLVRGGATTLSPSKPKLEMDPSDQLSWQREYRFT